jgi:predicted dithiol-disulfide oxidoreductase (DUF899 family)
MALPQVVSPAEWEAARKELLVKEKEMTRARDALNTERRRLPMVEVTKDYVFEDPDGEVRLDDLFDGRRQLIVQHFMFDPDWDEGCSSCTAGLDELNDGFIRHINARQTSFAVVARAPIDKIETYKHKRGWTVPFVSSYGSDFNYDFRVTLDRRMDSVEYNYRPLPDLGPEESMELPGKSCFLRDGDRVFHTYSMYARGTDMTGGSYYFLDLTALGRQEDWEEPKDRHEDLEHGARPDFS